MTVLIGLVIFSGGLFAGFLTGLLGVGGGVVMVPLLYQVLLHLGAPSKAAFTSAVATSLAVMIFSGAVAAYTYHKQKLLKPQLILWLSIGTLLGAHLGARVMIASDDHLVRIGFGLFLWLVAASLFLPRAALQAHDHVPSWRYNTGLLAVGMVMGAISSLFGVGGGALLVPALVVLFGIAIHNAVATSTAIIVLTALFGSLNYMFIGWHDPLTPAHSLGWIHPLAWLLLLPGALLATRAGIRAAMGMSRERLRNVVVVFQIVVGARFIFF
jgi:uncharacterized membrane protein YfcA